MRRSVCRIVESICRRFESDASFELGSDASTNQRRSTARSDLRTSGAKRSPRAESSADATLSMRRRSYAVSRFSAEARFHRPPPAGRRRAHGRLVHDPLWASASSVCAPRASQPASPPLDPLLNHVVDDDRQPPRQPLVVVARRRAVGATRAAATPAAAEGALQARDARPAPSAARPAPRRPPPPQSGKGCSTISRNLMPGSWPVRIQRGGRRLEDAEELAQCRLGEVGAQRLAPAAPRARARRLARCSADACFQASFAYFMSSALPPRWLKVRRPRPCIAERRACASVPAWRMAWRSSASWLNRLRSRCFA